MLPQDLYDYFGTWSKAARELDLGNHTYQGWLKKGYIPYVTQCYIEIKTNKKFMADENHTA